MFTRLKLMWWALLGRPIVYRANLIGPVAIAYNKSNGPLFVAECTLGIPDKPMTAPGPDEPPQVPNCWQKAW